MSEKKTNISGSDDELEIGHDVRVRTGRGRFRTRVEVRGHVFAADEPESLGGTDLGPTPVDLLCAALGSCTTITLRMYADRKGWDLEEVTAQVSHAKESAAGGEAAGNPTSLFSVVLRLTGDLSGEQRMRLIEIAGRCPVHRTLAAGARVQVRGG